MIPKLHELTDRWAALLLVLVIIFWLFAGPLSQKADAVVVSSVIVGAVIATMALAGITFVASGMTAAQLQDWVSDKLNEWAADLGSPLDHLINSAGIGVTISGLLTVGTAAAQGISDFITWLKGDQGITDNSEVTVYDDVAMPVIPYVSTSNGIGVYIGSYNGNDCYANITADKNCKMCYITSPYRQFVYIIQGTSMYGAAQLRYSDGRVFASWGTWNVNTYNNLTYLTTGSNYDINPTVLPTYSDLQTALSKFGTEESKALKLSTGVLTIPQVQNDEKVFLDVGALPGSTVTDVTDGVIEDAVTNTLDVSGEVAESEPEYVIDGPEPVYGLADVFPFCIPFDLYDFVSCLAADPVAPHFEWRLYVEDLVDYTFVIDLQQFETVAQIFRTMFLLAFIIGLAMVTRHLLRS